MKAYYGKELSLPDMTHYLRTHFQAEDAAIFQQIDVIDRWYYQTKIDDLTIELTKLAANGFMPDPNMIDTTVLEWMEIDPNQQRANELFAEKREMEMALGSAERVSIETMLVAKETFLKVLATLSIHIGMSVIPFDWRMERIIFGVFYADVESNTSLRMIPSVEQERVVERFRHPTYPPAMFYLIAEK